MPTPVPPSLLTSTVGFLAAAPKPSALLLPRAAAASAPWLSYRGPLVGRRVWAFATLEASRTMPWASWAPPVSKSAAMIGPGCLRPRIEMV